MTLDSYPTLGRSGLRVSRFALGTMTLAQEGWGCDRETAAKLLDDYLEQMPLGRVGTVNDVAEAVRFLAGSESSWITGACIPIDGGHHLRRGANYSLLFEP